MFVFLVAFFRPSSIPLATGVPAHRRVKAAVVLLKCQIALGVLAMPTALSAVGAVPGALIILGIGLLTTWSDYTVGLFKRNHPEVYSLGDVGFILAGPIGREVASFMYAAFMIAIVGAGIIPIAIAFNAVTSHAACTVIWALIGAVVCFSVASIQTLNRISLVSWVGFVSIMGAIVTLTIAVGVQDRPAAAPPTGPWDKNIAAFKKASFFDGIAAISTAICASFSSLFPFLPPFFPPPPHFFPLPPRHPC